MTDLFKKLNVLVKSSLNDILGDDFAIGSPQRRLDPAKLGKDIDREIAALRGRINEALSYEDELRSRVQALSSEVSNWDQQADDAVSLGNDAAARYAVEQMQRTQQRVTMAQSDLDAHQLVAQELIQKVNMLEAAVADARRSQAESSASSEQISKDSSPAIEESTGLPGRLLADVLREAREKIMTMGDIINTREEINASSSLHDTSQKDDSVADDLVKRRERLSKPK